MAVYRRKPGGSWYYTVTVGLTPSGKRKQQQRGGFPTKRAAEQAARQVLQSVDDGSYIPRSRQTLGQYLMDDWLPSLPSRVKPSTFQHYAVNVRCHIVPRLGGVVLIRLTALQIEAMYADLLTNGRVDGRGGLSPRTVNHVHRALSHALGDAVRNGKVPRNVAAIAKPPSVPRVEMRIWSPQELRHFLDHMRTHHQRLYALWALAATTGMRRGEILGLQWADLDLGSRRLVVSRTVSKIGGVLHVGEPKTANGRRVLSLDEVTVASLRTHKAIQAGERLAWGEGWRDEDWVFTKENGTLVDPYWVSHTLPRFASEAGLPKIRFHDLRHSYASAALMAGVHSKVVSTRLGHATVGFTLDTYAHALPAQDEDAAERTAAAIFGSDGAADLRHGGGAL